MTDGLGLDVGDCGEGNKGSAVMGRGGGACGVVERLVRAIVASSLGLSENSGKTSRTVFHSFSNFSSIRLSLWLACK